MKLRNPKDFWSGVMFGVVGFAFAIIVKTFEYPMGTASRMGPGYFPFALGLLLGVLGLIIMAQSFGGRGAQGERVSKFAWRPMLWVLLAFAGFGLIVKWLGIALSIIALVLVSAYGGHEFRWKETLIASVVLAIGSVAVFVYGLKLPFPIWPSFIAG